MTRRWDSLLFLWLPGFKFSFLLFKTYMNESSQRNRLLISFLPLHVCINPDTLQQQQCRGRAAFISPPLQSYTLRTSMKPMGNFSLCEAEKPKPSHPNSSEAHHILQPLWVPSIFHLWAQVRGVLALGPKGWLLVLSCPVSHSCSLPHPWTRIFHYPKPQLWQRISLRLLQSWELAEVPACCWDASPASENSQPGAKSEGRYCSSRARGNYASFHIK